MNVFVVKSLLSN